jgi:hypothetical protein
LESIVPEIKEIAKKDIVITGRYHDNLRVVGQGFKHSIRLVYEFVKKYPKTIVESLQEAAKVKYYSSKQLSIWLSIFRKDWSDECPKAYLEKLLEDIPIIKKVLNTVLNFKRLMK